MNRSLIEKGEIASKERAFQLEGKTGTTNMERERVWMDKKPGVTTEGCAREEGQGKAASAAMPPVLWGVWTSSSRPEGLGRGQRRRGSDQGKEERRP